MPTISPANRIPEMYPVRACPDQVEAGPAGPALGHLAAAWAALDGLEESLPGGPDRWQADSLFTAREGVRRAWLALSNLSRSLDKRY